MFMREKILTYISSYFGEFKEKYIDGKKIDKEESE